MKEAMLYEKLDDKKVNCHLCAHRCTIKNGRRGICHVRENRGGTLYSLVYGKVVSFNVDPIEKKPLFHFLPGSRSLSISTAGCNFRCLHCQNSEISQFPKEHDGTIMGSDMTPESIVEAALKHGCESISYTYTEPTIFMEFAYDCAKIAHAKGIKNVFVSNGYMTPESVELIAPYLDGDNIDLKGDEEFYKKICGAHVEPVKNAIRLMKEKGVWVEVTTLIIPDYNDSDETLTMIAGFIKSVSPEIPWHVTQYYPTYRLNDKPRTPLKTLKRAREIGLNAGLHFVFEGNVPGEGRENTYCHHCGATVIKRTGFSIIENRLSGGLCPDCRHIIPGIWT
ncbi:molybdenum cofactor biosynthesis protein A [bacterium BMS3Abin07]|nr:molybdenum cofactor biosynthesis protein A [bacterium BMS3Abin07]GBE33298.1 molybdenum cofactor biosynthesis protein A [bacterium BMS3Bbin05]HDO21645.1 AmmeMemoRadiSam system radical SAM enzyme [Nitrospirota bacterium]HDZ87152.1 AmmeMemoRadiSam system radical SAM enzyme [Nitrospirota bacterium]